LAGYSAGCNLVWGNANTPGLNSQVWRGSWPGIAGDVGGIKGYGEEGVSGGYVIKKFKKNLGNWEN